MAASRYDYDAVAEQDTLANDGAARTPLERSLLYVRRRIAIGRYPGEDSCVNPATAYRVRPDRERPAFDLRRAGSRWLRQSRHEAGVLELMSPQPLHGKVPMPEGSLELVRSGRESERQDWVRERTRYFWLSPIRQQGADGRFDR